jgi:Fe-S-cluster containining protein
MQLDFSPFFAEYEQLAANVDRMVQQIKEQYPDQVTCHIGCTDCCYAMFDLSLVEAMYLNTMFRQRLAQETREAILRKADEADREAYRIKRHMYKERQKGKETEAILKEVGKKRVRCPLLQESDECALYEHRPLTCRVYGVPMAINEEVHTCALSGFEPGGQYPTIYMDRIQDRLVEMSQRLVQSIPTKHIKLAEVLVPVSMALLNEYDEDYLGIVDPPPSSSAGANEWIIGGGS